MRSLFYLLARFTRDINAVSKGPKAVAKRSARKFAVKKFSRLLNKVLK